MHVIKEQLGVRSLLLQLGCRHGNQTYNLVPFECGSNSPGHYFDKTDRLIYIHKQITNNNDIKHTSHKIKFKKMEWEGGGVREPMLNTWKQRFFS